MTSGSNFGKPLAKGRPVAVQRAVKVTLACGHETSKLPELGNPDRWWCCHAWQKRHHLGGTEE